MGDGDMTVASGVGVNAASICFNITASGTGRLSIAPIPSGKALFSSVISKRDGAIPPIQYCSFSNPRSGSSNKR